jgi:hypothetical protein
MGSEQIIAKIKIAEIPEILFFSVFACIASLNINFSESKTNFESAVRCFLIVLIALDFVVLGMIYSENIGSNMLAFSIVIAIIPTIIALPYKKYSMNNKNGGSSNDDD